MLFQDRDLIYLDYLCNGKPIQLNKNEIENGTWLEKKSLAVKKRIDLLPVQIGSSNKSKSGWSLLDVKKSEKEMVYSENLKTIYRGDSFLNALGLLLSSEKGSLLLILDEHNNLKGVLNIHDLTNLYFVSRVYMSLHVLEVLGLQSISLSSGGLHEFNKWVKSNSTQTEKDETLKDILDYLKNILMVDEKRSLYNYFKINPSENRGISSTNLSIYELRNNTMHPRVRGKTSFKIDQAFLRDFTYVEHAIKDLVIFCKTKMGEVKFNEWVEANI